MRLTLLIAWTVAALASAAPAGPVVLRPVALGSRTGYVLTEAYAGEHTEEIVESIPGLLRADGFWSPSDTDIVVADRVFRELILDAVKDPTLLFPSLGPTGDAPSPVQLAQEQTELAAVADNFDAYQRQYVGIIVDGTKQIFCNYADVPNVDAAAGYILIQKTFVPDGTVHFVQCRFDPDAKTCSNVSLIGSWRPAIK